MAVPPITCEKIYAIPIANVGAPPVRDKIVCSQHLQRDLLVHLV